jgi:predicted DNA-binding transcriptional regulator AlpA
LQRDGNGVTERMDEPGEGTREWIALGECARRLGISRAGIYGRIKRGTIEAKRGNRGGYIVAWPPPGHDGQGDVTLQVHDQSRDSSVTVTALQAELGELRVALARAEGEITTRNAVIAELRASLDHERARSEKIESAGRADTVEVAASRELVARLRSLLIEARVAAEARRPWWRWWFNQGAGQ